MLDTGCGYLLVDGFDFGLSLRVRRVLFQLTDSLQPLSNEHRNILQIS